MNMLTLGEHYVSDFINHSCNYTTRQKYPLNLMIDNDIKAVKLTHVAPMDMMYGKYWYRSGINSSMKLQLKNIVDESISRIQYEKNDIWLDIACNDGTLLSFVPNEFIKLGIDPADDSFYNESSKIATKVSQTYFSYESYNSLGYKDTKCKIITVVSMFYDLPNPQQFIEDIYKILDNDGILVIQMSYTPLMIKQLAFDNICHEHVYYYSLTSIKTLFEKFNFKIVDCSLNDTNGGSFRVYLQKNSASKNSFGNAPLRDVCDFRIQSILTYEQENYDISNPEIWKNFDTRLSNLKSKLMNFITTEKEKGKTIYGYGASTKGNTLLQYFGLDNKYITAIAERSHYKFGLKTIGTNIPIISEEQMRKENPDYLLVLPWHFIDEFELRESEFIKNGGKLIVPCPEFKIIG